MRILVTGGCGYIGSVLVPMLKRAGHEVAIWDLQWFGNHLQFAVEKIDFRSRYWKRDAIIHLAAVANDPAGDLDPALTWETNALGTQQLIENTECKHFIYASSGSVYGLKTEERVTEDLPLVPLTAYNKSKMVAERVVLSYSDRMKVCILRPATVCGVSPRQRLDVVVNVLTHQALRKGEISLYGGSQIRPHVHIVDMARAYLHVLERGLEGIYNCGFENMSNSYLAKLITALIPADIRTTESSDNRSYRLNSSKLLATGFEPKHSVKDAISDIAMAFRTGKLKEDESCYSVKWLSELLTCTNSQCISVQ